MKEQYVTLSVTVASDGIELHRNSVAGKTTLSDRDVVLLARGVEQRFFGKIMAKEPQPITEADVLREHLAWVSGIITGICGRADAPMLVAILGPVTAAEFANLSIAMDKALEAHDAERTAGSRTPA